MRHDFEQATYWIDILHGNSPGLINIVSTSDWAGRSFDWSTQSDEALNYVASLDAAEGIYLRTTTLRGTLEPGRRGSDADSLALPGLWADLDLAGPGHKTTQPLPETFDDAMRLVAEAGLPEPSLWIMSGGGLYPWWLFDQPKIIATPDALAVASGLSQTWQQCLGSAAKRLGWHYGTGVGDMARVLRIPGTINRKVPGDPRLCRILSQEGRPFGFDELVAIAAEVAPEPERPAYIPSLAAPGSAMRPGDDFNNRAQWDDHQLLGGQGARVLRVQGGTTYWVKPNSRSRDHHATTGRSHDKDRFYPFTDDWAPFEQNRPYDKFAAFALLHHGGDLAAATKDLAAQGYGEKIERREPRVFNDFAQAGHAPVGDPQTVLPTRSFLPQSRGIYDYSTSGAVARFCYEYGRYVRFVVEEKIWRVWNGVTWAKDETGAQIMIAFEALTEVMRDEQIQMAKDDTKADMAKAYSKHIQKLRDSSRTSIMSLISARTAITADQFDANPRYFNLLNGIYDMVADKFIEHDPKYLLTKVAGVSYDPDALAPGAEDFLEGILPDSAMREFTLQALGYSLTGEADCKAFFVLQGLSNSGKTQLTEMNQMVFGDYAVSVSPGTFAKRQNVGAPVPELHDMRGARLIYTSETSHDLALDEETIKRFTGKDTMTTRTLYQKPQRWVPQGTVWVATNNLPRFSQDEEAMWRRVKTIRFTSVFTDDGSSGRLAVSNIGRTLAAKEASGIFNLLLSALRRYRAAGRLVEPDELVASVASHREDTDPLLRHLNDLRDGSELVADPDYEANQGQLYLGYRKVCEDEGTRPLGPQRFGVALKQHLGHETKRSNNTTWMVGWRYMGAAWMSQGAASRRRE